MGVLWPYCSSLARFFMNLPSLSGVRVYRAGAYCTDYAPTEHSTYPANLYDLL